MRIEETIKRILREETQIPSVIRRRVTNSDIEEAFLKALDFIDYQRLHNQFSPVKNISLKTFTKLVIDEMATSLEQDYFNDENRIYFNDETYHDEIRVPLMNYFFDRIKKRYNSEDEKVVCQECGWSWDLSDGGDDPYTCHKCGHTNENNLTEYSRTLKNARQQGAGLRFPKSAIKANPLRFRPYNREGINESDPKKGTGKKPKGSGRRLYTDENPNDTVSVKFRTKEDIVDTLNKDSFKSKPHKRQSQIINLIHQRVRAAYQNAKDPETKQRLKRAYDYIETVKEKSKEKTIRLQKQKQNGGLHDTSWENDEGDKITLMDLLNATEDIPVQKISVEQLKSHLLSWDGDEEEIKKIEKSDLQYPILIFVEDDGSFISIIDGHHRAQKAVRKGLDTIKAKIIPINSLPKNIRKVFSHMGKQEEMKESELTEKCWSGYTQKGMKTMFGKRYPNCVKKKKK